MQAMGRAIQQGSHQELPQEEREITYYIHAATLLDQLPKDRVYARTYVHSGADHFESLALSKWLSAKSRRICAGYV